VARGWLARGACTCCCPLLMSFCCLVDTIGGFWLNQLSGLRKFPSHRCEQASNVDQRVPKYLVNCRRLFTRER
jgi:hypothetical protein